MRNPISLEAAAIYHVYNRGTNGENIFREERNYAYFLKLYGHYVAPTVDTFAYCLMKNHFHLLIRVKPTQTSGTPQKVDSSETPTISTAFKVFFNTYAKAFNKAYGRTGSLLEHPYRRKLVDSEAYLTRLVTYIHHNPQKHGFVDDYREWPYSSYRAILSSQQTQIARDEALAWFGSRESFVEAHLVDDIRPIAHLVEDDWW